MLQQLLSLNIFAFFLIFARMGTALVLFPGFSAGYIPVRIRLSIALAISFVLAPVLAGRLPAMPETPSALLLLMLGEVVVGVFFGVVARILVGALQTAGTLIALFSSMANALIQDPIAEQQSSTVANFLATMGVLLVFVTDLHHLMLRSVVDSYGLFVPGQPLAFGDFSDILARRLADSFELGLQLSAPILVTALTYYIGLGLLGRLMPALPVFFFGLPIQLGVQIFVLMLTVSGMMMVFLSRFEQGLGVFLAP